MIGEITRHTVAMRVREIDNITLLHLWTSKKIREIKIKAQVYKYRVISKIILLEKNTSDNIKVITIVL